MLFVPAYWDGAIPWVSPKDMKSAVIEDTEDHITDAGLKSSPCGLVQPDALLMVVRSGILQNKLPVADVKNATVFFPAFEGKKVVPERRFYLDRSAKLGIPGEVVELDNGVSLDFAAADGPIQPQHYAFLISEADFDAVMGRIREKGLQYWADPIRSRPGEINHNDGGRGVYFPDPDGHYLEVITRPVS